MAAPPPAPGAAAGSLDAAAAAALLATLPPEVEAEADAEVLDRFAHYARLTAAGHNFTAVLRSKADFGNPYILDAVIAQFAIDQHASNYPPHCACSREGRPGGWRAARRQARGARTPAPTASPHARALALARTPAPTRCAQPRPPPPPASV